jgi:hypothetical protein
MFVLGKYFDYSNYFPRGAVAREKISYFEMERCCYMVVAKTMGFMLSIQIMSPHLLHIKKIRMKTPNQATQWREKERTPCGKLVNHQRAKENHL